MRRHAKGPDRAPLHVGASSHHWPAFTPPRWPAFTPPLTHPNVSLDRMCIDPGVTAQLECLLDDVVVGKREMVGAIDAVCDVAQAVRVITARMARPLWVIYD